MFNNQCNVQQTATAWTVFLITAVLPCSDQGALQQQPRLQQQVADRLQLLKQQLQQVLAAGGSSCEGAGGQEWQDQVAQADDALGQLLRELQSFHRVYQQVIHHSVLCIACQWPCDRMT